jgi:flagella basal body P-ring formation protein FlgA
VRLTCPDADGFKIAIRTQIDRFVADMRDIPSYKDREATKSKFVVVTKSLQPGEIIGTDDVILIQRDANPGVGYFSDVDDVVGRKAKKAVTVNKIIRTRHLELDYAIQKDQSVIIESQIGPVTVFGAGIAVTNAQLGDRVRAKNKSSGMVVEGVAISEKKIRIRAK